MILMLMRVESRQHPKRFSRVCQEDVLCASSQFTMFSFQKEGGLRCFPELRLGGAVTLHGHYPMSRNILRTARLIIRLYYRCAQSMT